MQEVAYSKEYRKSWTSLVLRQERCSPERVHGMRKWCREYDEGGLWAIHIMSYGVWAVAVFQDPDSAFAFKMRWG